MNDEQGHPASESASGLLQALRDNLRAGAKTVRLFEAGRVFSAQGAEESTHLALVFSGITAERSWRGGEGSEADLFHLKGVVSAVLGSPTTFTADQNPALALALVIESRAGPWASPASSGRRTPAVSMPRRRCSLRRSISARCPLSPR
ncbi:MAG: hypothetical protein WDN28_07840 [Chthoniobacter sp.]